MPDYYWECQDSYGKRVIVNMPAPSIQESKVLLERQGYHDLRLQTDDTYAAGTASFGKDAEKIRHALPAEERIRLMRNSRVTWRMMFTEAGALLKQNAGLYWAPAIAIAFDLVTPRANWATKPPPKPSTPT